MAKKLFSRASYLRQLREVARVNILDDPPSSMTAKVPDSGLRRILEAEPRIFP